MKIYFEFFVSLVVDQSRWVAGVEGRLSPATLDLSRSLQCRRLCRGDHVRFRPVGRANRADKPRDIAYNEGLFDLPDITMAKLFSHWMLFGFGVFLCGGLRAATIQWTGAGGNDSWSTPTNWSGGVVPGDGDDVLFGANSSTQASLNFSLQLGSFTFASDATYTPIHVGAGTASTLTLSGAGIINDPGVGSGGPIRQDFFADAGGPAGGGTILFANTASV